MKAVKEDNKARRGGRKKKKKRDRNHGTNTQDHLYKTKFAVGEKGDEL